MGIQDRYSEGYATGWASVLGPRLTLVEIPLPPTEAHGSNYILGLINGIEAARAREKELAPTI
jgi:hypothetical protein